MMKIICMFLFISLAGCNERKPEKVKDSKLANINENIVSQTRDSLRSNSVATSDTPDLRTARSIDLITLSKTIDSNTAEVPYYRPCATWTLSKAQIESVFRKL